MEAALRRNYIETCLQQSLVVVTSAAEEWRLLLWLHAYRLGCALDANEALPAAPTDDRSRDAYVAVLGWSLYDMRRTQTVIEEYFGETGAPYEPNTPTAMWLRFADGTGMRIGPLGVGF
jgi:hypothetical protein